MIVKLETVHSGYSASKINANFEKIQDFINYYCVSRYDRGGAANEMWTDIIFDPLVHWVDPTYSTEGLNISQSVLEVLHKPSSDLRMSQSVLEVLCVPVSDIRVSQSVLEVLYNI
jgi:hypothetical protein